MPVLNGEQFIESSLKSILDQKGVDVEIIVVNDGCTDSTPEIVSKLIKSHPNIRMIDGPKSGVANARNTGVQAINSQSNYVGFLDADDLYPKDRLSRQLALINAQANTQWVVGLVQIFEALDEKTLEPIQGSRHMTLRTIQLGSALFRREVFEKLIGFDASMLHGEDTDFFLRLLESDLPYLIEEKIAVLYRRHQNNMTNSLEATRKGFITAIKRSLERRKISKKNISISTLFKSRLEAEYEIANQD